MGSTSIYLKRNCFYYLLSSPIGPIEFRVVDRDSECLRQGLPLLENDFPVVAVEVNGRDVPELGLQPVKLLRLVVKSQTVWPSDFLKSMKV